MAPHVRIRPKSKESKKIDHFRRRKFAEIRDDRIGQVFPLRYRGFDLVSVRCVDDRVGQKGSRR